MTALFCGAQQEGASHIIALWKRVSTTVFVCVSGFDNVLQLALVMRCLGVDDCMSSFVLPFTMQPHATGFSSDLPSKKVFLRRLAGSISSAMQHTLRSPFDVSNRICPKHGLEASYVSLELVI